MTELQMPRKVLQLNMETQLKMLAERKYGKGLSDCTDRSEERRVGKECM